MKKTLMALGIIILVGLIIGGKWYMAREKDKRELLDIQTDLANYLYNNYNLYTKDSNKAKKVKAQYDNGRGSLTEEEYIDQIKRVRIYSSIEKIKFEKFSTTPMNTVEVYFTINGVYDDDISLDTISAETGKLIYHVGEYNGEGPYYLEKKKETTNESIPEKSIVYYKGGIN